LRQKKTFVLMVCMPEIRRKTLAQLADIVRQLAAIIDELQGPAPDVPPEVAARVKQFVKEHRCLLCKQVRPEDVKFSRGCEQTCYQEIQRQLKLNETTERELIERGFFTPEPARAGRKRKGPTLADALANNNEVETNIVEEARDAAAELISKRKPAGKRK